MMPSDDPHNKGGPGKAPEEIKGVNPRKRVWTDYNADGTSNDTSGVNRDQRGQLRPGNEAVPSIATIFDEVKKMRKLQRANALGISHTPSQPRQRPATGGSGASQPASGGTRAFFNDASKPEPKVHLSKQLTNKSRSSSVTGVNPTHKVKPSFNTNPSKTVIPSRKDVYKGFKAPNSSRGVSDDSSGSGSEESYDSSKNNSAADDVIPRYQARPINDGESSEYEESFSEDGSKAASNKPPVQTRSRQAKLGGLSPQENAPDTQPASEEILETPSGKPYNMLRNDSGALEKATGIMFPDGYRLQDLAEFPTYRFICPVRTCRRLFQKKLSLIGHFSAAHAQCHFIDNLDQDGTLTLYRKVKSGRSMVVIQKPLDDNAPALEPPTLPSSPSKKVKLETVKPLDSNGDDVFNPSRLNIPKTRAPSTVIEPRKNSMTESKASGSANPDPARSVEEGSREMFALEAAELRSDTWKYVGKFVKKRWLSCFQSKQQRSAFLQAISLPKRNKVDRAWLDGTYKSHQKAFKALISIAVHIVGVKTSCNACEGRLSDRQRNCMTLPPEAKDMRELQDVFGSQCVNCFFFPTSKTCDVVTRGPPSGQASYAVKKSPVPVPDLPPPVTHGRKEGRPRPTVATWSRPVSNSPVPVPVLPPQAPVPRAGLPSEGGDGEPIRRSERHSGKEPNNINNGIAHSDVTSSDESVVTAATAVASKSTLGAPPAPSALVGKALRLFGEITELPASEQGAVYDKVAMLLGIAGGPTRTAAAASRGDQGIAAHRPQAPAADGWEIAPGLLTHGGEPVGFSKDFLRRETVNSRLAYHITPKEKALNKHMAALQHLQIEPEADWDCELIVMSGLVNVKMGSLDARVGAGGVFKVRDECVVVNTAQDEARIQVRWKMVDE